MRKILFATVAMAMFLGAAHADPKPDNWIPPGHRYGGEGGAGGTGGAGGAGGAGGTGIGYGGTGIGVGVGIAGAAASSSAAATATNNTNVRLHNTNTNLNANSNRNNNRAYGGQGGSATINNPGYVHTTQSGGYSVRTVGVPNAPALAPAGIESCMSSMSLGSGFMGGSAALGIPVMDKGCDARLFSRTMSNLGLHTAAVQMLCHDRRAAAALATQGIACQIADGEGGVNFLSGMFGNSSTSVQVAQPQPVRYAQPVARPTPAPAVRAQRTGTNGYHWEVFGGWTRD